MKYIHCLCFCLMLLPVACDDETSSNNVNNVNNVNAEICDDTIDNDSDGDTDCDDTDCSAAANCVINNVNNLPGICPTAITDAILACVEDQSADPDYDPARTTRLDLIELCTDAEVVSAAWDALCSGANPPADICGMTYEQFATDVLPGCGHEVLDAELDGSCVFGSTYGDLWRHPGATIILGTRILTAADALSPLEEEQVVEAVHASSWTEVTTAEEAFAVVDGGQINQVELWDASGRRAFTAYEYGAGDNSYGMIFAWGTTTGAARIGDGDLYECNVLWGAERRPCGETAHCADGLTCSGNPESVGRGTCLDPAAVEHPANGTECSDETPCPGGAGLVCAGGITCNPAWMRGRFVATPATAIPDNDGGGRSVFVPVYGLATVSTDVLLDLFIIHSRPADLIVTLVNPAGTEVVVFDREPGGSEIYLRDQILLGFPGDESVNGLWELRVVDTAAGSTGTIESLALTITSRMD
ncbi:proprotein convertase P-domain-containing protein [Myxococcota bacterium]|nr:proprotein convertase P-domain-containing protein [Myxococcota bacterium]MBU1509708.1 proprotein convertase P-domain-containing protein [Myxococcota bacterium]